MSVTFCDRCGDPCEAEGSLVLRCLSGQLPERRPRVDLCEACSRKFSTWLAPVGPPVEVLDDDQADELEAD